jgi:hypothetical protein
MSVMRPSRDIRDELPAARLAESPSPSVPTVPGVSSDDTTKQKPKRSSSEAKEVEASGQAEDMEKPRDAIVDDSAVSDMEYMSRRMKRTLGDDDQGDVWEQDAEDTGVAEASGSRNGSVRFVLCPRSTCSAVR